MPSSHTILPQFKYVFIYILLVSKQLPRTLALLLLNISSFEWFRIVSNDKVNRNQQTETGGTT